MVARRNSSTQVVNRAACSRGRIVFRGWFKTRRVEDSFVGLEGEIEQLVYGFLRPYGRMKFSFVKGMG